MRREEKGEKGRIDVTKVGSGRIEEEEDIFNSNGGIWLSEVSHASLASDDDEKEKSYSFAMMMTRERGKK